MKIPAVLEGTKTRWGYFSRPLASSYVLVVLVAFVD